MTNEWNNGEFINSEHDPPPVALWLTALAFPWHRTLYSVNGGCK